jgi:hypothetical protein
MYEFSEEEIKYAAALIPNNREQIVHCFQQLVRFANLAQNGEEFRAAQFGLNLGRVQEMLGSVGGVAAWWRVFEPLLLSKDYEGIISIVKYMMEIWKLA